MSEKELTEEEMALAWFGVKAERQRIMDIMAEAGAAHQFVKGEEYTEYDSGWSDAISVVSKVIK